MPVDRYFYHSFPRPRGGDMDQAKKGLRILECIVDFGLVLTPEAVKWGHPHADGSPPRTMNIAQRRVCFTELSPLELPRHAEEFGSFALEFEIAALKSLHALPVFYIPRGGKETSSLGQTLVIQLTDAMCLIDRMARVKQFIDDRGTESVRENFMFGFDDRKERYSLDLAETKRVIDGVSHAVTPLHDLSLALEGMLNMFYFADADETRDNNALKYYRQREWRIAGNIGSMGRDLMGLAPEALKNRLMEIDSDFYSRPFPDPQLRLSNPSLNGRIPGDRRIDWVYVYQGIDERHIIGCARRILVPRTLLDIAKRIVAKHPRPPAVEAIEGLQEVAA